MKCETTTGLSNLIILFPGNTAASGDGMQAEPLRMRVTTGAIKLAHATMSAMQKLGMHFSIP
jgi:hypothetical protein